MKTRFSLPLTFLFLILPCLVFGQRKSDANVNMSQALIKPGVDNVIGMLGLNPANFSMTQSYSMSFMSGGGETYNMGLYLNTMKYRLSDPLTLHVQLGVQHSPFGDQFGNGAQTRAFVSSAGFQYKPNDTFKLEVDFSQRPAYYYNRYSPFNDPISRNRSYFDWDDEDSTRDEQ